MGVANHVWRGEVQYNTESSSLRRQATQDWLTWYSTRARLRYRQELQDKMSESNRLCDGWVRDINLDEINDRELGTNSAILTQLD